MVGMIEVSIVHDVDIFGARLKFWCSTRAGMASPLWVTGHSLPLLGMSVLFTPFNFARMLLRLFVVVYAHEKQVVVIAFEGLAIILFFNLI